MDNRGRDLDAWEEVVEKAVNAEAKASLQPPSGTREIDSRCPKGFRPSVKKDKDEANREHRDRDKDKDKAKPHNPSSANSQPQTQASKKDKRHGNHRGGHPATEVNATEIAKKDKDKDKAKDLSHIKCYTYKQKGHYANKCPEKSKNLWRSRRPPRR